MTENEFWALSGEQRRALPRHVHEAATLTTLEQAHELLTLEGWTFIGLDDDYKSEPDYDPTLDYFGPTEIWRRQVGGRVEWCELFKWPKVSEQLPPEQCWCRLFSPIDPRLIEV